MADKKISQLTGATTPLAGTEEVPLVQSSTTKKVTVADMTAGRAVSVASLTATTGDITVTGEKQLKVTTTAIGYADLSSPVLAAAGGRFISGSMNTTAKYVAPIVWGSTDSDFTTANPKYGAAITGFATEAYTSNTAGGMGLEFFGVGNSPGASQPTLTSLGTWTVANGLTPVGNIVQGTAAKGVNFTANSAAAGMTSQLLNWYEEGTWTPNQGAGLTVVGAFSSSGTYTRVGRQIMVRGQIAGATSVAVTAAGVMSSNLPYTAASTHAGSMFNNAVNASGVVQIVSTSVIAATTIAATLDITFTATYTV